MTQKEILELLWRQSIFFPNHIVIWSDHKYGDPVCIDGVEMWYARGRPARLPVRQAPRRRGLRPPRLDPCVHRPRAKA